MGWWPFGKKSQNRKVPDVIRRDTRTWLSDLQEICEKNFDNPEEARRQIRQMAGEWKDANSDGIMDDSLFEGLNMRAYRLLNCRDDEFSDWLDMPDCKEVCHGYIVKALNHYDLDEDAMLRLESRLIDYSISMGVN